MTEQEFKKEIEDIVPITLLSEKHRAIAKEMSKENSLNVIKYIKEHSEGEMGFKMSKWYYDMYINNEK